MSDVNFYQFSHDDEPTSGIVISFGGIYNFFRSLFSDASQPSVAAVALTPVVESPKQDDYSIDTIKALK